MFNRSTAGQPKFGTTWRDHANCGRRTCGRLGSPTAVFVVVMVGIGPILSAALLADGPATPREEDRAPSVEAQARRFAAPTERESRARVLFNEVYSGAEGKFGLLDAYLPGGESPMQGFPAVIVIHGGGWTSGDKWTTAGYCRQLAERGYVAININYRLAPRHKFPAQVDDVRDALLWVVDQADRFSIDTKRIGLFGYSAGGHLSALVGVLSDQPPSAREHTSSWPADDARWDRLPRVLAVCAGGPPCEFRDLPPSNTLLAYFFGGSREELPELYKAASPTVFASPGAPVMQIIHGENDLIVPAASSRALYRALVDCGADCRYELIPGQGHMVTFLHPKTEATMLAFFDEVLAGMRSGEAP